MFEFFRSLFNPSPPSGATAKERLRLVLLSDHLSLAPDVMEAMKRDLLEVLSRYVEIDMAHADVTFEQREAEVAMLASVPITGMRDRKPAPAPEPPQAAAPPAETPATEPVAEPAVEAQAPRPENARPPRRRRRKKPAGQNGQQGQIKLGPPGIAASQA
jgi:cell division topological specificity factor